MGQLILVTGGCRSGKSSYAQKRVELTEGSKTFIATCPKIDREMDDRIHKHQQDRANKGWHTIEEELDLPKALQSSKGLVLIDCLTLWINNLLYQHEQLNKDFTESDMVREAEILIKGCRAYDETIYLVTNEVGLGVVPPNQLSRRFIDCSGRCNQIIANAADEVIWMISGIPQIIKSQRS